MDVIAIIEPSQMRITPFLEHPRQLPILNTPLEEHQRQTLDSLSIRIADTDSQDMTTGRLVLKDTVFCSKKLLATFLEVSVRADQPTQCAIKKGALTQRSTTITMDVDDLGEASDTGSTITHLVVIRAPQ